jgi:hypothetical protein
MWEQEKEHVKKFEELLPKYRVRPTALLPFWNVAGYALGNMSTTIVKLCLPSCSFFKKHPYASVLLQEEIRAVQLRCLVE